MAFALVYKFGYWTFLVLIYAVIAITIVILERKRPEKTISWLLVFAVFPLIGFGVYLFFGRNWKKKKLTSNLYLDYNHSITDKEKEKLMEAFGENIPVEY